MERWHINSSILQLLGSVICLNRCADAQCNFSCTQRLQHKLIESLILVVFIGRTSRELVIVLEVEVEVEVGSVWLGIDSVWD